MDHIDRDEAEGLLARLVAEGRAIPPTVKGPVPLPPVLDGDHQESMPVTVVVRFPIEDVELSRLHARAFGGDPSRIEPWSQRLTRHALTWVGAFSDDGTLVGFVQVAWDGGPHAFMIDTAVDPDHHRRGIGTAVARAAVEEVRKAGCEWLHVDFEPHLETFYLQACGFHPAGAGVLRLNP